MLIAIFNGVTDTGNKTAVLLIPVLFYPIFDVSPSTKMLTSLHLLVLLCNKIQCRVKQTVTALVQKIENLPTFL
ncbi:hypothetical protein QQG55_44520 [Brugia pahangi]